MIYKSNVGFDCKLVLTPSAREPTTFMCTFGISLKPAKSYFNFSTVLGISSLNFSFNS